MQPAKGQVEMTPERAEATTKAARASKAAGMDNAAFVKEGSPRNESKSGKREAELKPANWLCDLDLRLTGQQKLPYHYQEECASQF